MSERAKGPAGLPSLRPVPNETCTTNLRPFWVSSFVCSEEEEDLRLQ